MTTLLREIPSAVNRKPQSVVISDKPRALEAIYQANCAAAIWQRSLLSDFATWIENLDANHLPNGRLILQPKAVQSALNQLFEIANTPVSQERDFLINDIVNLAELFCEIMDVKYLRLRLDKISDNACLKFHKDVVTARLICAYRGTGTQYGFSDHNQTPNQIKVVPTGSPIIMRGTLWPEIPKSGFLHRSPPIEGIGKTRLLLVLDPAADNN
ncbi:MAG: DUF1826 domain-containing protein [Pseudomonadota bacterium]